MIAFPRLSRLPEGARLWLYGSSRALTAAEQSAVLERLEAFMQSWTSHGRPVLSAAEIGEGRILAIGALIEEGQISGCGIDKSVHVLKEIGDSMDVEWLTGLAVAWRDVEGHVQVAERPAFRAAVKAGDVTASTTVIDLAAMHVADLERVERPASQSWHARVFAIPADNMVA